MDEKGFMMGVALPCKVICRMGTRAVRLTPDESCERVTVIEAVSGDGRVLRPMIINKGQAHYMGWYAKLKKSRFGHFWVSKKGWSREMLGLRWLKEVFDSETREREVFLKLILDKVLVLLMLLTSAAGGYRLLILNGHMSPYNSEFFDYYLNVKIIPFCLPAHSTHLLQPLDVGLFSPLQRYYSNGLDDLMRKGHAGINKLEFLP